MPDAEPENVGRLLAAGVSPRDIIELAEEAVRTFEHRRKPKGRTDGPIGRSGCVLYASMLRDDDHEPDLGAFSEFRLYTHEKAAERAVMGMNTVGRASNNLIKHGFFNKRREGRQFSIRLGLPAIAIAEAAERWANLDPIGTMPIEVYIPLGRKLMTMYPLRTSGERHA